VPILAANRAERPGPVALGPTNGTSLAQVAFSKRLAIASEIIMNKHDYIYVIPCGYNLGVSRHIEQIEI
jgi:hypothetical protein